MSECESFEFPMLNRDGEPKGIKARITHSFEGDENSAMLIFAGPSFQAHIHTNKDSVLALAMQIIKELAP